MGRAFRLAWLLLAALLWSVPARAQDVECDPGEREVLSLDFRGNHAFTDDELALRINTTPSSWARRNLRIVGARRCLNSGELLRDVYRLRLFYRNAGYFNTSVDTAVTPVGRGAVKVAFLINEGEPLRIVSFAITGLDSVPDRQAIVRDLWTRVGRPFNAMRIGADHDSIIARLRNSGYPQADVLWNYETNTDSLIARVSLDAVPGPRAHIRRVEVAVTPAPGRHQEISDRVVRKLLGIGAGALYSDRELADAQRNLYQTGAYRFVQVAPVTDSMKPLLDSLIDLRVTLVEDYMRDLNTETGWASLDCFRTRAQVVDKNFAGGARRLEVTGQLSKIGFGSPLESGWTKHNLCLWPTLVDDPFSAVLNYSANATLRQPTLFGTWATPSLSVYRERRGEYKAYLRTTYIGGEVALLKALRENASLRLGYNLEYGRTEAQPAWLCALFSRCDVPSQAQITRPSRLSILSATYGVVHTDNPINPSSGWIFRAETRNSATFFGSDRDVTFAKGVGDLAWYHPLGAGSVFALRLRGGVIGSGAQENGIKLLPPQERLYAGGASSVRGYQQNELGQLIYVLNVKYDSTIIGQDTTSRYYPVTQILNERRVPVGGNSMFVGNIEWRLRDPFLPELLQWTLFTDVGQVWNRGTTLAGLGLNPRWTPGLGLRLFTPVGPVQVNVGYNPYAPVAGPAYTDLGKADKLYCVEPTSSGFITRIDPDPNNPGKWIPHSGDCGQNYQPGRGKTFVSKLTLTFSVGPEF